jgi:hypothetical protein
MAPVALSDVMLCYMLRQAYDVLNDVYPGFKAADLTERPWMGAVGSRTRPISHERLLPVDYEPHAARPVDEVAQHS